MENNEQQALFAIEKLYVKDISVEVPNAPEIFLEQESPQIEIQLNTMGRGVSEGVVEVVLTVTVTARIGDKTVFLVEVGQAGIFRMMNIPEEQMEGLVAIACPNILFPYAREVVSDAIVRAGFQPIVLQPVNFEQMYMERLQQEQGAPAEAPIQ